MLSVVLVAYLGLFWLLNTPQVQQQMSVWVSRELAKQLGSELTIGRINMGLLNRIIIDDLLLNDQSGKEMLRVARLSAKFEILPLFNGKISIGTIQLFGFNINIEKHTPDAKPNYQFVIDAFASKDTVEHAKKNIDLRINSVLIRRGRISYNVLSEKETPGKFNANHVNLQNIIANISLKALQNDSINAAIKRLSVEEKSSGFELKKLSLKLVANNQKMDVSNFAIDLPNTSLKTDTIRMEYDSIGALTDFTNSVRISFRLQPSKVTLADLSAFVPAFVPFKEALQLEVRANGPINSLRCPYLSISAGKHFRLLGEVSFQDLARPIDAYVIGELSHLYADPEGIAFFVRNLSQPYTGVPPTLQHLGSISFRGQISGYFTDLVTYGQVRTNLGIVQTDVKLSSNKERGTFAYSGEVKTENFDLGTMVGNKQLGKVTLGLTVNGIHASRQYPDITMQGSIASIEYSQYLYENILLDGIYKQGGFNGKIRLDDKNGSFYLDGSLNAVSEIPTFNFRASVDHFRPHELHLTPKYEDAELSVRIKADFTGGSIDEMNGEINIDSLQYQTADRDYFLDNLNIRAIRLDETQKRLTLSSRFLQGSIEGDYSYRTLPVSVLNIMRKYVPALILPDRKTIETENNFYFDLHLFDTELLSTVFQIPLKLYTHSTLKGYFNDKAQRIRIEGYFPRFRYEDKFFESGMILCENPGDQFHTRIRFTNRKSAGSVNLSVDAKAQNDSIQTILNWGNSSKVTYSGQLSAIAQFIRQQKSETPASTKQRRSRSRKPQAASPLTTIINVQPTDIILNDTLWKIHPSQIVVDSGKVHINEFRFTHKERYLRINGILSDSPQDTVRLDLKKINIGYVFDIAALNVNFKGEATGQAYANGVLKQPVMSTNLHIRNFGLNDGLLGDADIQGKWHHDIKGIYLDAHIREQEIAQSHVYGFIYPLKPTSALDLQIEAQNTNLKFVHHYMNSITPEFNGRVSGNVHFYGKFKALTMDGRVTGDASMKVEVLNTTFSLKDSILITPDGLTFNNNRIYDTQGHEGRMSGELRYEHFKNLRYRFNFSVNNMLVMNTRESHDFPFYGTKP